MGRLLQRQQGVTLLELLAAFLLVGILSGIAVPSMRDYLADQRVRNAAQDISYSLLLARSEAVKRAGVPVSITAVDGDWSNGWLVTNDAIASLWSAGPFAGVVVSGPGDPVIYDYTGRPDDVTAKFLIEDAEGRAPARCVTVTMLGLPSTMAGECP